MMKKDFLKGTVYAAVFGIIGGLTFQGYNYVSENVGRKPAAEVREQAEEKEVTETGDKIQATNTSVVSSNYSGVSEIAEEVLPSIVAIDITATKNVQDIFGRTYERRSEGSGSGIIISQSDSELLIVTNNHVVSDADKVSVKFNDESVYEASVKGTDSTSDLAVVSVKASELSAETLKNIKVAALGNSDDIKVGEQAIAIGNALGYGTSVTVGYISAKDREVTVEDASMKLLQTDAAINPGNSGGALVNSKGEVIGINSVKYASEEVEGMGFAIPISKAIPIIEEIKNLQAVPENEQAYLGIRGTDVSEEYAEYYNMPEGVYVGEVSEDSPAGKGGLWQGDIIVGFNDKEIKTMDALQERLSYCKAGDKVIVTVKRLNNGKYSEKKLTITLGNKSEMENQEEKQEEQSNSKNNSGNNGSYGYGNGFGSPFGW